MRLTEPFFAIRSRSAARVLLLFALAMAAGSACDAFGQGSPDERPFADPDLKPASRVRCDEVRALTRDVEAGPQRIDLSVVG